MRLPLIAGLLVAALISLSNAVAHRSASVTSGVTMTITATDSAGLALIAGTSGANIANTAYYSSGANESLYLDFRKGIGSAANFGFGPPSGGAAGDKYRYRGLFQIRNNSNSTQVVYVYVDGGGVSGLEGIYLRSAGDGGSGTQVASTGGSTSGSFAMVASTQLEVDFWWNITSSTGTGPFNVWVKGMR